MGKARFSRWRLRAGADKLARMTKITLTQLKEIAEGGDAQAQYALAGLLSMRGEAEEAEKWLQAAADQGEPDALYTMATRSFFSRADIAGALAQLEKAAAGGSTAGQRLSAALKAEGAHVPADWSGAVDLLVAAGEAGDPVAKREAAMLLFAHDVDDPVAAALLTEAAEADAPAAAISVCRVIEGRQHTNREKTGEALKKLEAARYPNAETLRAAFASAPTAAETVIAPPDWAAVKSRLHAPQTAAPVEGAPVLADPDVKQFPGAFTREECEYLIAVSVRLLAPSMIVDPETGQSRADPYRSSLTAILGAADMEMALVMLNQRIARYVGQNEETGEFLSILRYASGQEYRPHYDWLPDGDELSRSGQRTATALLYLNEEYEGGETHFLIARP